MSTVDRRQGSDRPRSARTDENTDQVNYKVLSQEDQPRTYSTVRDISRKTAIPKSSVVRICIWNALRGDVRKSWLRRTALLVSYFWRSFPSLPGLRLLYRWKDVHCGCMQQWKNCENRLRFNRVKANTVKRVLSVICTKFGLLISRGSAATHVMCGGQYYMSLVANFIASLAVKRL